MLQARHRLRFAHQAVAALLALCRRMQGLDRDLAVEHRVVGRKDCAHAARTERTENDEAADQGARRPGLAIEDGIRRGVLGVHLAGLASNATTPTLLGASGFLGYSMHVVVNAPSVIVGGLAALIVAAAVVVALIVSRRRRALRARVARKSARLRHPLVLAHGLFGFDRIAIGGREHSYFRGVTGHLMRVGAEVHRPCVPPSASIALRAEELARRVGLIRARKVNILAHSMGGLDVRYALARFGLADRVASVVTIGTPHGGTPVADLGVRLSDLLRLKSLLGRVVDVDAFYDLTTERMQRFNRDIADVPGVVYTSVVARIERARANPLLWPTHAYLSERAGDNDGMVPLASQRWGEVLKVIEADHWAQIGWSSHFDALAFYEELLRELRGRGF